MPRLGPAQCFCGAYMVITDSSPVAVCPSGCKRADADPLSIWNVGAGEKPGDSQNWRNINTPDEIRMMAVHEAGHCIVALRLGKDVAEVRINVEPGEFDGMPYGGGYSLNFSPKNKRSYHACSALGGYFACAIHCRDNPEYSRFQTWDNCREDLRLFNIDRGGMSFRQARRITLEILRENESELMLLASILERDGYIDHTNAPREML